MNDRASVSLDDDGIPADPGVYVVYCDVSIGHLSWTPDQGPIYIGRAEDSIRKRIATEHLSDTGRSTLRRSYGALLKNELSLLARPRRGGGAPPRDEAFTHYIFEPDGELRLTDWMRSHLTVAPAPTPTPKPVQEELISRYGPPLNLTGWDNPWRQQIKDARRECVVEARQRFANPAIYHLLENDKRQPRARSADSDFTRHGHWVQHRLFGWVGRIAYQLVETSELVILWNPDTDPASDRNFYTFEPSEVTELDRAPKPWLRHT
ncbi:MAG: GIY-YIG nuclease family protein [Dehalococcoidia bacterium]